MLRFDSSNAFKGKEPLSKSSSNLNGINNKRVIFKTLQKGSTLPADFESSNWAKLQSAIRNIYSNQPIPHSLEDLYRSCEDLCNHKLAASLYAKVSKECEVQVNQLLDTLRRNQSNGHDYLMVLNSCWLCHCQCMILIRSIFLYLDRTYVLQTQKIPSLWDMGLQLFKKQIMEFHSVRRKCIEALVDLIERERKGESIPRMLLKSIIRMHLDLGIYASHFENDFMEASSQFYHQEGLKYVDELDPQAYLHLVERRLTEENDRCMIVLDKSSRTEMIEILENELLRPHLPTILEKGLENLLASTNVSDLELLYSLSERVDSLPMLRKGFSDYIKKAGLALVMDPERDPCMVDELLKFKMDMDMILSQSFKSSTSFNHALQESFESFINKRQNKPAELIAKYLDTKLRSGNKTMTDEEMEQTLHNVLTLFRYIESKDIFEAFYKRDLAKRLLLNKSASDDAERSMLSKLKDECGAAFTQKLEGMFTDIDVSRDILKSFHASRAYQEFNGPDMDVKVLTMGYWPTYPRIEAILPEQLIKYEEIFKTFYLSKHSGRKLTWQHSLGYCVVKARFPKGGVKELDVSLFQALVLLIFNDVGDRQVSFKEIRQAINLDDKELKRTLQSLACGKVRVLLKHPKGKEVEETDEFSFNSGFTESRYRIRINQIQLRETKEENKQTTESVFEERQFSVDAAIVRIMKSRKTLHHRQLVSELYEVLKFPIQPSDLKKRIESLIDREYLERSEEDSNTYKYLA